MTTFNPQANWLKNLNIVNYWFNYVLQTYGVEYKLVPQDAQGIEYELYRDGYPVMSLRVNFLRIPIQQELIRYGYHLPDVPNGNPSALFGE